MVKMTKEKNLKIILKITAVFLWYFVALFFFIVWDMSRESPLFQKGTTLGDMMARSPYQWDFELFFAGLFLVWGIFVWRAAKNIQKDLNLIKFTGWAFLVHAVTMIIVGAIRKQELIHLLNDSIYWFLLGFLILYFAVKGGKERH